MTEKKILGLGLIGCGAFGRFCLDVYSGMDGVRAAGVADVCKDAADDAAKTFGVPGFGDPGELIAQDNVDIVHIATPPSTHHDLAMQAIKAGKNVLCEKPLAMNLAQADEVLAAARGNGKISPVNFVLRYNAVTKTVKAVIDSGVLGNVLSARLTNCAADSKLNPDHWFWDKNISGGIFIEHGVHFFDLYRYLLGPGEVISAHTEIRPGTNQEDRVMCTVRHDNGTVVSHYHGFDQIAQMDRTNHRMVCEMGDIWIDGWIPLSVTIEGAVDDDGAGRLAECCGGADVEVLEEYRGKSQDVTGRGQSRHVSKRIRLRCCPNADKQTVYSDSVRNLMADQIAFIRDRKHVRRITESNGRDALALAEAAVRLAEVT